MSLRTAPSATPAVASVPVLAPRSGSTPAGLALCGILLVVYPLLRPYSSEVGTDGARAFASWQWSAAHLCAMASFVLLAGLAHRLADAPSRAARWGSAATRLGAVLVLPYYGAEVFGVGAVGRWALATGHTEQVRPLVADIRYAAPALLLFAAGLLLLAVGGVSLGIVLWRAATPLPRTSGVLLAAGLASYLPQFFLAADLRVLHGAVLGLGLVLGALHLRAHGRAR